MSVVGWPEFRAFETQCMKKTRQVPRAEWAERYIDCMRESLKASDVVERIYRQVKQRGARAPYCPPPKADVLHIVVAYVVDRVLGARGELATVSVAPLRRQFPRMHIRAPCIAAWLGLEDCVFSFGTGKVIFRLACVKEKLGLE